LEDSFKKFSPYQPFDFYFFDEDFDRAYRAEQKRGRLYKFFAAMSILIAWPAAYLIMHKWLQIFAYRVNIHIGFFLLSAVLTLLIAWITSGYQSIKASLADPVDSLRYE